MSKMKKLLTVLLAGTMMFGLVACGSKKPEGAVAEVNGTIITEEDFEALYGMQRGYILMQGGDGILDEFYDEENGITFGEQIRSNILNQLVVTEILAQEGKKEGIEIDAAEVETELAKQIEGVGGVEALGEIGISEEMLKKSIEDTFYINGLREAKMETFKVDDKAVEDYFEEHKAGYKTAKASHILVETEEEAKDIIKRLEAGEDFAELAMELSQDPGSAQAGGELGEFGQGQMVATFDEYVFSGEVGAISDPIQSDFGYHIIKITDRFEDLEHFKEDIEMALKGEQWSEYVDGLQKRTKAKIYLDPKEELEKYKVEEEAPVEGEEAPEEPAETTEEPVEGTEEKEEKKEGTK